MSLKEIKRNPWPYAIIAYFVVFISAMTTWVVVAMGNDMDLVRKDYYEHEIRFQQQIDKVQRTAREAKGTTVKYDFEAQQMNIALPMNSDQTARGSIKLYRPSNARLDQTITLAVDNNGRQSLPTDSLQPGFWRVQISWNSGGEDYYFEQPIVVAPKS